MREKSKILQGIFGLSLVVFSGLQHTHQLGRMGKRMRSLIALSGILYLLVLLPAYSNAKVEIRRILYVDSQRGNDSNEGTSPKDAFKTITRAARAVRGGDKLIVGPGVYYERPVFTDLRSSKEKPVWIISEPPGAAIISGAWKEAAEGEVKWKPEGDGIYSVKRSQPSLFGWTESKHFLFRYMKLEHLRSRKVPTRGQFGMVIGPESGFAWGKGRFYLRLPGGVNPNGKRIMFSPPTWGEKPIVNLVEIRSTYVILDGFRIQGSGTYGVVFYEPHGVVRNCIFEYCREGVAFSDDSLAEWCEYSYPGYFEFAEETRKSNGGKLVVYPLTKEYHPRNWYEGSLAYSIAGKRDPSPRGLNVHHCFVHQVFDGLALGGFDDSEAHHNVFLHSYDNHVELETWTRPGRSKNLRFHHNLLLSSPGGPISHQEPNHLEGPHYVYRNVVVGYDEHGWHPWTLIKSQCYGRGRGFYYYHNLFLVKSAELYWNEKRWPQEWLKTFEFKNNIFIFTEQLKRPTGPRGTEDLFKAAGNIVVATRADPEILDALLRNGGLRLLSMEELLFHDDDSLDFGLTPGSPAIDRGVRISGFNDNARGRPDIGPFELGDIAGPDWPRPQKTVFNTSLPAMIAEKELPPILVEPHY